MKKKIKKLWIAALKDGEPGVYRKLGKYYLAKKDDEWIIGKLCLQKAAELGDEKSFWLYHSLFSRGKKVLDDSSYKVFLCEWNMTSNQKEKKRLRKYLELGTEEQKKTWETSFGISEES